MRAQEGRSAGIHRRLCRACGGARQIRAPAGGRRGHVSSRPLRPHHDRERGSRGGEMNAARQCKERSDEAIQASKKSGLLRFARNDGRTYRFAILVAGVFCLSAFGAAGWWIASLGAAPLGNDIAFSTRVLDRDGRLLRAYAASEGRWRLPARVADVDPRFFAMLFAYEDKRFRTHPGVDALALARAAVQLVTSGRIQSGGSTLTMQVARLLEPRSGGSLTDKLRQIVRAIELERAHGKDEILSLYLDLAPYGGNIE